MQKRSKESRICVYFVHSYYLKPPLFSFLLFPAGILPSIPSTPSLPPFCTYAHVEEHQVGFVGMQVLDPGRRHRGVEVVVAKEGERDRLVACFPLAASGVAQCKGGGVSAPVAHRRPAHEQE